MIGEEKKHARKLAALAALSAIYEIAERLYRKDAERFKPIYGWVGAMVKQRRDIHLVLRTVKRIEEKEALDPVRDVAEYLGGTLRKIEQEEEAKKIRAGGATMQELLGPVIETLKGARNE